MIIPDWRTEFGAVKVSFSGLINDVEVSPISTTVPSIDPVCNSFFIT
jgi:hypothetical protein